MQDIYADVKIRLDELLAVEDLLRLQRALEAEHGATRAWARTHTGQPRIANFGRSTFGALDVLRLAREQGRALARRYLIQPAH